MVRWCQRPDARLAALAYPLRAGVDVCAGHHLEPSVRCGQLHVLAGHQPRPDVLVLAASQQRKHGLIQKPCTMPVHLVMLFRIYFLHVILRTLLRYTP